jgi:hypothetical protein
VAVVGTIEIDDKIEKADWAGQYVYRGKMDSNKPAPAAAQQQSSSEILNISCWEPKRSYTRITNQIKDLKRKKITILPRIEIWLQYLK